MYAASQFRASTITGVRFFRTVDPDGTGDIGNARFTFALSTTGAAVNSLNTMNLSATVGADNTQVLDLLANGVNVPFGQSFTLLFTKVFNYDPSLGNLVLDIAIAPNGSPGFVLFNARNGDFGNISSRALNCCGGGLESYGLVTRFLSTPFAVVPEASTWSMMRAALVMVVMLTVRWPCRRAPPRQPRGAPPGSPTALAPSASPHSQRSQPPRVDSPADRLPYRSARSLLSHRDPSP